MVAVSARQQHLTLGANRLSCLCYFLLLVVVLPFQQQPSDRFELKLLALEAILKELNSKIPV